MIVFFRSLSSRGSNWSTGRFWSGTETVTPKNKIFAQEWGKLAYFSVSRARILKLVYHSKLMLKIVRSQYFSFSPTPLEGKNTKYLKMTLN